MTARCLMLLALALLATASGRCQGALFTSTLNRNPVGAFYSINTQLQATHNNAFLGSTNTSNKVNTGATQTKLTVDTTNDTAHYDDIDFLTPSIETSPVTSNAVNVNYTLPVSPPNFPDPPVIITVMGNYMTRVTLTSIVTSTPQYVSSPTTPIVWNPNTLLYGNNQTATFTMPDITLNGTYEAIGPITTVSVPFSITLHTSGTPVQRTAQTQIPGASPFGDGFLYFPNLLSTGYNPTPSGVLFNQVVDNVRFVANKPSLQVNFFEIPEPSTLILASLAATGIRRGAGRGRCE